MRTRCEAVTGYTRGDHGFTPVHCHQWLGLVTFTDAAGYEHTACAAHAATIRARFGVLPADEPALQSGPGHRVRYVPPDLTPWFRAGLEPHEVEALRALGRRGIPVHGFARGPHGPFTCRIHESGAAYAVGVGASAHEAYQRACAAWAREVHA